MKWSIERTMSVGLCIMAALVIFIAAEAVQSVTRYSDTEHLVEHTRQVLVTLETTLTTLLDSETAARGYTITGDERYLEPYNTASESIDDNLRSLRELTVDNPHQQTRLDMLEPLAAEQLHIIQQVITARRNDGFNAAQQIVIAGGGKASMDQIRTLIATMKTEENSLLLQRTELSAEASRSAGLISVVIVVLAFVLLLVGFYFIRRDIATRKQTETYLLGLLESAPDAMVIVNVKGEIVLVNSQSQKLFGYSTEALIGQSIEMLVPERFRGRHPDHRTGYFDEPRTRPMGAGMELYALRKDGSEVAVEISLSPLETDGRTLVFSTIRDVTERRRAQAEIAYQANLLANVNDAVIAIDNHNVVTYWNRAAEVIYGWKTNEIVGKVAQQLLRTEVTEAERAENFQKIAASEHFQTEIVQYHKNGKRIDIEATTMALRDGNRQVTGYVTVNRDITRRRESENTMRQALAKEKELGELKSRFVSMASHEFRTPLATILALTETLTAYRLKLSEEQIDQRLGKIQEQVGHLKDIMDDVLELARMQARRVVFNPVQMNLHDLCRSVLDEFQSRPGFAHQITFSADDPLREVKLDRKLMRQVLSNLISNAVKYSPEGKAITVSLECVDDALVLKVADQGIGIPEADLPYLFEPFHRASNVGTISGTGLGLVITKESIELQGGTITVNSQVDVGTTFTVHIPMSSSDADNIENPAD